MKKIIERETTKGTLVISHDLGTIQVEFGNAVFHDPHITRLPTIVPNAKRDFVAWIYESIALRQSEVDAIESAVRLYRERETLAYACDNGGAFPGSTEWLRAAKAEKDLAAFDMEHPEIIAEIQADKEAKAEATAKRLFEAGL